MQLNGTKNKAVRQQHELNKTVNKAVPAPAELNKTKTIWKHNNKQNEKRSDDATNNKPFDARPLSQEVKSYEQSKRRAEQHQEEKQNEDPNQQTKHNENKTEAVAGGLHKIKTKRRPEPPS